MSKIVTGIFETHQSAQDAVYQLEQSGFGASEISLVVSDGTPGREWAIEDHTKAAEGATAGAVSGGVFGALVAGLTSVGTITTGGLGLLAAGPIVAALAGAGAGGGAGGLIGALIGAGIPEHEAEFVESELEQGRVLVGVRAHEDRSDRAEDILSSHGAISVKQTST